MTIESIWVEATKTCIPREGDYVCVSHENIKKFAELIINECADVVFKFAPSDESACKLMESIEKHFGIKD